MPIIPIESPEHWHDLRRNHIGASEIQALLIENDQLEISSDDSYVTQNELYFRKKGIIDGFEASPIMEFGNVMEPIIAHMLAAQNNWTIEKAHDYHEHPKHPFLGCTLDYYALETPEGAVLLQIKNVVHTSHKWTQTKATPYVEIQVQQELMVVNAARKAAGLEPFAAHCIGSMHKGNPEDIRIMYRPPLHDVCKAIIDAGHKFWSDLQAGREPDINSPKDYAHIMEMVRKAEKSERVIDLYGIPEVDELARAYQAATEQRKAAEKREDLLKAKLMRYCMSLENDAPVAHIYAQSDAHVLNIKEIEIRYKAKEAYVGKQTRFTVKEK